MSYFIYILLSNDKKHNYVGKTNDLVRRLLEHNRGDQVSTKGFGPWKIVYTEKCLSEKIAREREKFFKSGIGRELKKEILSNYIAGWSSGSSSGS